MVMQGAPPPRSDDDAAAAFQSYLDAKYPFNGAPDADPFAVFFTLLAATDPAAPTAVPPPLIPAAMRLGTSERLGRTTDAAVNALARDAHTPRQLGLLSAAVQLGLVRGVRDSDTDQVAAHHATRGGAVEALQLLVAADPNAIRATDRLGRSVGMTAAEASSVAAFDAIVAAYMELTGEDPFKQYSRRSSTMLSYASWGASTAVYARVLERYAASGMDPLHADSYGVTAVHTAAESGHIDRLKLIVEHIGGDTSAMLRRLVSSSGSTVAHAATMSGSIAMIEYAVSLFGGWRSVPQCHRYLGHFVKTAGCSPSTAVFDYVVAKVREHGIAHAANDDGWTPMHSAAAWKNRRMLDHLVSRGYCIDAVDNDGYSVLHAAANSGSLVLVRFVAERLPPATRSQKTEHGSLATLAVAGRHTEILHYAVTEGLASMADTDHEGSSLVLLAVHSGSPEMLAYCLKHGGGTLDDVDQLGRGVMAYVHGSNNKLVIEQARALLAEDAAARPTAA